MKTGRALPRLLYSYLATEMLAPFFASFIIMNCVFFLVKLIPFLNFVLELHIGLADFARLFAYLFPNIFLYTIPMAAMMGVTIGFARLSSDSEILALKASGISIVRILPPVIIVAALIALLTSYFSIKLIPLSEMAMKQLTYQLLKEKINKGIKEHVFTEALGDVVVYVDKIDKKTGAWTDVWVSDMRGVDNPVITMASTGSMKSSIQDMNVSIILENGSLHRPSTENAQIVQFDRYHIDVPLQPKGSEATTYKKRDDMNMSELLEWAKTLKDYPEHRNKVLIEFHKRLVLPVGCLMISIIGLPLGLQARPGKKAIGIQAGLGIFVLYYVFFTFGKSSAEQGTLPVALAMWLPNIFFFCLAVIWIVRITNEQPLLPLPIITFFTEFTGRTKEAIRNCSRALIFRFKGCHDEEVEGLPIQEPAVKKSISGNPKSRVFHVPACEYFDCKNCTLEFKNIQVALDAGFEPCRVCKEFMNL
jgi:lipopolysaccharide export system permease protein